MNIILLYILFFSYELYYASFHLGIHTPFLAFKIVTLFLCASFASVKINKSLSKLASFDVFIIFIYLLLIFASSLFSISPLYVVIYGLIFIALQIFSIHISNTIVDRNAYSYMKYLNWMFIVLIVISLAGYILSVKSFFYRDVWGNLRVQGVYGEPSRLSQICALNIFLSIFYIKKRFIQVAAIAMSFWGLVLAGNRSYMFALIIILYLLFLHRIKIGKVFGTLITCIVIVFVASGVYLFPEVAPERIRNYLRLESVTNLSGRIDIWKNALPIALKKPLGAGFQLGGSVLVEGSKKHTFNENSSTKFNLLGRSKDKTTLHNGYIQSLCDLGVIGFLAYIMFFLRGLFFVYKNWAFEHMRPFACILIFFTIVNFSATVLVSPTTSNSLLFWLSWFVLMFNWRKPKLKQ